jgi:long-chain acyl-CoA synthetase
MSAYYKSPEQTAGAFDAEGWLRTGDLGYRDADGYYFITGRLKELIIKGGENIAPREIDEALLKHPAVLEAASVGIPDPSYGQEIRCVHRAETGRARIRQGAARVLPARARPLQDAEGIQVRCRAAERPSGKVQRLKLA